MAESKILRGASVRHTEKNALAESKADQQKFIDKFGKDIFDLFSKSKDRLKNADVSTDILYHVKNTSPEDMKNILNNLRAKVVRKGDDVDLTKIQGEYRFLGSKDGYDVYEPLDVISSMSLGVGSGWCTTGRYGHAGDLNFKPSYEDAKEHWDEYTEDGARLFYFLQNGIGKYALLLHGLEDVDEFDDINTFVKSRNFELYNQQDIQCDSDIVKIPYNLINSALDKEWEKITYEVEPVKNGILFDEDGKVILQVYPKVTSVKIPRGITEIENYAFDWCEFLTSINIPDGVKRIGSMAFSHCRKLKQVTISNSVTDFGKYIFIGCSDNLIVNTDNKLAINYCKENGIATKPLTNGVSEGLTIHEEEKEEKSTGVKSNGIYSVMDGKWIKEPVQADIPDLDEDAFNEEFSKWEKKYFELLDKIC